VCDASTGTRDKYILVKPWVSFNLEESRNVPVYSRDLGAELSRTFTSFVVFRVTRRSVETISWAKGLGPQPFDLICTIEERVLPFFALKEALFPQPSAFQAETVYYSVSAYCLNLFGVLLSRWASGKWPSLSDAGYKRVFTYRSQSFFVWLKLVDLNPHRGLFYCHIITAQDIFSLFMTAIDYQTGRITPVHVIRSASHRRSDHVNLMNESHNSARYNLPSVQRNPRRDSSPCALFHSTHRRRRDSYRFGFSFPRRIIRQSNLSSANLLPLPYLFFLSFFFFFSFSLFLTRTNAGVLLHGAYRVMDDLVMFRSRTRKLRAQQFNTSQRLTQPL